jgi:hypothetical protein
MQAPSEVRTWNDNSSLTEDAMWAPFNEMALSNWLEKQHSTHDIMLYVCDRDLEASAWSRRCLRHADLHLLVGNSAEEPTEHVKAVQRVMFKSTKRVELVLLRHVRWDDGQADNGDATSVAVCTQDRLAFQGGLGSSACSPFTSTSCIFASASETRLCLDD